MPMSISATQPLPAKQVDAIACFHCGLPVPQGMDLTVDNNEVARPMSCHGCEAVAQAIVNGGLSDYYKYRTAEAPTAREIVPDRKSVV